MSTIIDVATLSGVSISTVSRTLSNPDLVAKSTRTKVMNAVAELNYQPNRVASGLRTGKTGALGLLVADLENPYFAAVTKGVQEQVNLMGVSVFVVDIDEHSDREVPSLKTLLGQTDGVIVVSPRSSDEELLAVLKPPADANNCHAVILNRQIPGISSIIADDVSGTKRAVEHLRALGHKVIAYVGGPKGTWSDVHRREGLAKAQDSELKIVDLGSFRPQIDGGYSAADLAVGVGASAVIAYNDLVAVGVLNRLNERGVSVPSEMSIIGFDDTFVVKAVRPQLSSVNPPLREMGAKAVELLISNQAAKGVELVYQPELMVRASSGVFA